MNEEEQLVFRLGMLSAANGEVWECSSEDGESVYRAKPHGDPPIDAIRKLPQEEWDKHTIQNLPDPVNCACDFERYLRDFPESFRPLYTMALHAELKCLELKDAIAIMQRLLFATPLERCRALIMAAQAVRKIQGQVNELKGAEAGKEFVVLAKIEFDFAALGLARLPKPTDDTSTVTE
jgi:hypothetical protein